MSKRRLALWRSLDSVVSQLGQAASSLMLTLTFVNILDPVSFGVLAAFWAIWMLIMSMNRAVFGEQLIAQAHEPDLRHGYLDFGFLWSAMGIIVAVGVACLTRTYGLIPAILCVALFVTSDMVRYGEMAGGRVDGKQQFVLLPIELLRLGAGSIALWMALSELPGPWTTVFAFLSSAVWVVFGLVVGGRPKLCRASTFVRRREKFERLMTVQFLTGTGLSQVIPFLALNAFGAAQFGAIRLAQSVLSPMTLVTSAFQPSLIRLYASRRKAGNLAKAVAGTVALSLSVGAVMTLVAVAGVDILGRYLIPPNQVDAVNQILVPIAVLLSLVVVGQPGGALIKVFRFGGISLLGQAVGISVTLVLCILATHRDIQAFVWALAVGSATTVTSTYLLLALGLSRTYRGGISDGDGI